MESREDEIELFAKMLTSNFYHLKIPNPDMRLTQGLNVFEQL